MAKETPRGWRIIQTNVVAQDRSGRGVNPHLSDVQRAVAADAAARDAREQAYRQYDVDIQKAWRNGDADPWSNNNPPTGAGSHGPLGARPGQPCTKNGWKGTLKRAADGSLYCDIGAHDAQPQFNDGSNDATSGNRPGWRVPVVNDRRAVRDAYQKYDVRMANMYRLHDGEISCPDCDGSGIASEAAVPAKPVQATASLEPTTYENSPDEVVANTAADHDSRSLTQRMQDHRRTMDALYRQHDAELSICGDRTNDQTNNDRRRIVSAVTARRLVPLIPPRRGRARCLRAGIRRRLSRPQCATRRPVARRLDQNSLFKIRRRS